ncbi:MAG: YkvA family protein [Planctomycetota bacterium]
MNSETMVDEAGGEEKALDFYQKLRVKIRKQLDNRGESGKGPDYDRLVETLAILPDMFHLAVKCIFDKTIPIENKGALVLAVGYVVSPIDLVPDFIPIAGWLDDLIVLTMGLNKFLELDKSSVRTAVEKHWAGEGDVLESIKHVLAVGDSAIEFLPKRFMAMIRTMFG